MKIKHFFFFFFFLISPLFFIVSHALSKSLPLDLISLLSLKSTLNDPLSTFHNWDPPADRDPVWCTWSGIRCDPKTGRVTSLDLSSRNLSGNIPKEIRYLSGLLHLNLSRNAFDGPLEVSIFELPELRTLDISYNSFNSTFPAGISNLKHLRVLNAYSNSFSGPLPALSLRFLEDLNLGGSYFEEKIPPEYGNLPRLRSLCLQGNALGGPIPPQLGFLSQLEHIEIGYNAYNGSLPIELSSLSSLKYMDIAAANLSGHLPQELGNLTNLETLILFGNKFEGEIPAGFARLRKMKSFDVSNNGLSGKIPEFFGTFSEMKNLSLMNNFFTGEIPETLGLLPNLEMLQLWNNSLTGVLPQKLGSSRLLWKLDASSNALTGPIPPEICSGKKLEKLMLFSNNLANSLPESLATCSSLTRLRLQDNNLTGPVPTGFGSLPNLSFVDLSNNAFSGQLPEDLGNAVGIQYLNVSGNSFGSPLPANMWAGSNLQVFAASSAGIVGQIPDFTGCKNVYRIELAGNSLNGTIPWTIVHCEKLLSLNLSWNALAGIIPWEISALPAITNVDLSHNFLTGTIPSHFDNCTTLETFDVSYNQLTGPVPSSSTVFRNLRPSSFDGNDGLCGGVVSKPCADAEVVGDGEVGGRGQPKRTAAGAIVWVTAAVFGIGLFAVIAGSRCFHARYVGHSRFGDGEVGPWKLTAFQRLNFTADDVLECLSLSNKIIGMGSAGTVYRAEMPGGEMIAVKKLWGKQKDNIRRRRGVLAEVDLLGNVRHRNIVRLLGCVTNKECTMLLYEYMPNGNLDELLHNKSNLLADWFTRYKIALSVAQGICYLHHDCDPVIVHRDLKPSNILLDAEMEARVADFGVAKLIQSDESMSVIAGSYGYIAPEYAYTLQVDEKSDIYSYGVVLMEILSGKRSVDPEFGEGNSIVDWVGSKIKTKDGLMDVLDKNAGASCASVRDEMKQLLRIALLCTGRNPADRPSMRDVVLMLQEARPKRKLLHMHTISIDSAEEKQPQPQAVEC